MPTPEYNHDPEFPFLVVGLGNVPYARFHNRTVAQSYAHRSHSTVIDTTPKPRIPVDAEHLMWVHNLSKTFAYRISENCWAYDEASYTEKELLEDVIGRAEITVLDPREDAS